MKTTWMFRYIASALFLGLLFYGCKKEHSSGYDANRAEISTYYPNSGKGRTLVTIEGTDFSTDYADYSVTFNGITAEVVSVTEKRVVVMAPEEGTTGQIKLSIADKTLDIGTFTYQDLSISAVTPLRGQADATVAIRGYGFSGLQNLPQVILNDTTANILNFSDSLIIVSVPSGAYGRSQIKVMVDGKEVAGPEFEYIGIADFRPRRGGAGTRVTISGSGFSDNVQDIKALFGEVEAEVVRSTFDTIELVMPKDIANGTLSLVSGEDKLNHADYFYVVNPPTIATVTPLRADPGTEVTITGTGLSYDDSQAMLTIGNKVVKIDGITATEVRFRLPEGVGNEHVRIDVNQQVADGPYMQNADVAVTSMSRYSGMAGQIVMIHGAGFSSTASENKVTFNGIAAEVVEAAPQQLQVKIPAGDIDGPVKLSRGTLEIIAPFEFAKRGTISTIVKDNDLQLYSSGGSIAVDDAGNIYVMEVGYHRISKITPDGQVSSLAGGNGVGNVDGEGNVAQFWFSQYSGMVYVDGYLYVSNASGSAIRKINPSTGTVSSLYQFVPASISLFKITISDSNELFICTGYYDVRRMYIKSATIDGTYNLGYFMPSVRPAVHSGSSSLFYAESTSLHKFDFSRAQVMKDWAGVNYSSGYIDGEASKARFGTISSIVAYDDHTLLVLDQGNMAIRKIDIPTGTVSTVFKAAGVGYADGNGSEAEALFSSNLMDMAVGSDGAVYILDNGNNAVRKLILPK